MAFSSHLDPPNWNQQQLLPGQLIPCAVVDAHHEQHLLAPRLGTATVTSAGCSSLVQPPGSATSVGSSSSARPGSMAERARLAKIPQPEPGFKCPRCDSTNTKFCYFNNYSLSQPRHFCKACRRYWTRGGALRNVPVGGVCRRNKRKKSSKHPSSSSPSSSGSASATTATVTSSSAAVGVMPPQLQLPAFGSLNPLWCDRYSTIGGSRLGFPGLSSSVRPAVDYQLDDGLGLESLDRWRLPPTQQFPLLTTADAVPPPPPGLSLMSTGSYSFDDAEEGNVVVAANLAGMASVKMDDNPPSAATSSPRELLGLRGSPQLCGSSGDGAGGYGGNGAGTGIMGGGAAPGGAWSDLSAFNSPC